MICSRCDRAPAAPARSWCPRCLEGQRAHKRRVRAQVIALYGGACTCCGETAIRFLTIVSDGTRPFARADFGDALTRLRAIRNEGSPQDGLRCLCFNCLAAVTHEGICTHVAPGRTPEIPSSVNGHSVSAKHGGAETVLPR